MRYSADDYLAFLRGLISAIFSEYERIGADLENWQASFEILRPDFKKSPSANAEGKAETVPLKFTDKEISKMPKDFKKDYLAQGGNIAHVRLKPNGSYEIRCRRYGRNISASAKSLDVAKKRFLAKLSGEDTKPAPRPDAVTFAEYAKRWLEVVKKPRVKQNTFEDYCFTLERYLLPRLGKRMLKEIKPLELQKLLNDMEKKGVRRGSETAYLLLRGIFEFAVAEDLLPKSPMTLILKPRHETQHGQALTPEEEKLFLERCLQSPYSCKYALVLMLFTGIRRSELPTAEIGKDWVTVTSAKTRQGASAKKRKIPISPMLRKYLPLMKDGFRDVALETLTHAFPKLMPGRHLHELRHTFITRCQECGISRELTSVWAGHKADNSMTSTVYTHFSEKFQLSEAQKLDY